MNKTKAAAEILMLDLAPLEDLPDPEFNQDQVNHFLNIRRMLIQEKVQALPATTEPADERNFVLLQHRLHAQIELLDLILEPIANQLNKGEDHE